MQRALVIVLASAFMALVTGCSKSGPTMPQYVEPQLAKDQAVILQGADGVNITSVDMLEIKGSNGLQMAGLGGNKVTVSPGKHRISYSAVRHGAGPTPDRANNSFEYEFKAGHTYKVKCKSLIDSGVVLYDATDRQLLVDFEPN